MREIIGMLCSSLWRSQAGHEMFAYVELRSMLLCVFRAATWNVQTQGWDTLVFQCCQCLIALLTGGRDQLTVCFLE